MSRFHRGRGNAGKAKVVTLHLTLEEYAQLRALAERNLRSATGQAVWLVLEAIARDAEPTNQKEKDHE